MSATAVERIERELILLVRRAQRVHLPVTSGARPLERAAYAILGRLDETGPQRLSAVAVAFGIDPSTASRQVHALTRAGLVRRAPDPDDRRAVLLALTEQGRAALRHARAARRRVLRDLLESWSHEDRLAFARLLEQFNEGLSHVAGSLPACQESPRKDVS